MLANQQKLSFLVAQRKNKSQTAIASTSEMHNCQDCCAIDKTGSHIFSKYAFSHDIFWNFTTMSLRNAWRGRATNEGEWFSTKYGGGTLGEGFAVYRGNASRACAYDSIIRGKYSFNSSSR